MKKLIALLLALTMVFAFAGCAGDSEETEVTETTEATQPETTEATENTEATGEDDVTVMTYEEFAAAELDSLVCVETYVQAKQGWWTNDSTGVSQATFYTQAEDGAYFLYDMPCSEEEYEKLVPGTKIRVTGYKSEWAGEVEIVDATFEILEGTYVAEAMDATELLGTDELITHQNKFVSFTGMTVESIAYKNDEPGDDIYVTLSTNDASYDFCVEVYLTGPESEVYTTVGTLEAGDVVNVEGFLYWYEGPNPHITSITVAE